MVVIRLARTGSKKNPFYHVVVADKRKARDGGPIENVGYFNPMARGHSVRLELKKERIDHWLNQGAQVSLRVSHLIKEHSKQPSEPIVRPTKAELRQTQAEASKEAIKKKMTAEKKAEEAEGEKEKTETEPAAQAESENKSKEKTETDKA